MEIGKISIFLGVFSPVVREDIWLTVNQARTENTTLNKFCPRWIMMSSFLGMSLEIKLSPCLASLHSVFGYWAITRLHRTRRLERIARLFMVMLVVR